MGQYKKDNRQRFVFGIGVVVVINIPDLLPICDTKFGLHISWLSFFSSSLLWIAAALNLHKTLAFRPCRGSGIRGHIYTQLKPFAKHCCPVLTRCYVVAPLAVHNNNFTRVRRRSPIYIKYQADPHGAPPSIHAV